MSVFIPTRVRVEPDSVVRIHRKLNGKGTFSVSPNQQVAPTDELGVSVLSAGFRMLNLSQMLSVPPADVSKYLKVNLGQKIYKGELLAFKSAGVFSGNTVVVAPSDGVLDFINPQTGEIKMTFLPKKESLTSGVYGIVEQVDNQRGQVIIRIQATIVHGVFGSGRSRDGILNVIGKRDELIGPQFIPTKFSGQILVGGSLVFKEAISACISAGIGGIITGGINARDYKGMAGGRLVFPKKLENDIGVSIIVCEGFGSASLGEDVFEILTKYNSKFVSIDGNKGVIILPSFESKSLDLVKRVNLPPQDMNTNIYERSQELVEAKINQRVRIIGSSFVGEQGKLIAIDKIETILPSGVKAYMAIVETKRRKVSLPVANLEVML